MKKPLVSLLAILLSACDEAFSSSSANTLIANYPFVTNHPFVKHGSVLNVANRLNFAANITLNIETKRDIRSFDISWAALPFVASFTLCEYDESAKNNCKIVKKGRGVTNFLSVKLHDDISLEQMLRNELFMLFTNEEGTFIEVAELNVTQAVVDATIQYVKSSDSSALSLFGFSADLSDDGKTLAIGSPDDSSAENSYGNKIFHSGAVYLFTDTKKGWKQSDILKFSHPNVGDKFGLHVSINANGNRLAVAIPYDDSSAQGVIFPDDANYEDSLTDGKTKDSGAVVIFNKKAGTWQQGALLKSTTSRANLLFGSGAVKKANGLEISADGSTIAVGSNEANRIDVFFKENDQWSAQRITSSSLEIGDQFGSAMSLSPNGAVLAIGANGNDSSSSSNADTDNALENSGGVYIFTKTDTNYIETAFIKPVEIEENQGFGKSVSLALQGNVLAVGSSAHFVYLYDFKHDMWEQRFRITDPYKATAATGFGSQVALSNNGQRLAVYSEKANKAPGINNEFTRETISGAVTIFSLTSTEADKTYYLQSLFPLFDATSQHVIALSGNGKTLVLASPHESSNAQGINNKHYDNIDRYRSGAAWIYHF